MNRGRRRFLERWLTIALAIVVMVQLVPTGSLAQMASELQQTANKPPAQEQVTDAMPESATDDTSETPVPATDGTGETPVPAADDTSETPVPVAAGTSETPAPAADDESEKGSAPDAADAEVPAAATSGDTAPDDTTDAAAAPATTDTSARDALVAKALDLAARPMVTLTYADGTWTSSNEAACAVVDGQVRVKAGMVALLDANAMAAAHGITVCNSPQDPSDASPVADAALTVVVSNASGSVALPRVEVTGQVAGVPQHQNAMLVLPEAASVSTQCDVNAQLVAPKAAVDLCGHDVRGFVAAASVTAAGQVLDLAPADGASVAAQAPEAPAASDPAADAPAATAPRIQRSPTALSAPSAPAFSPMAANAGTDASAHFHTTITTNKDSYSEGSTAIVTVKYNIDTASINPGDTVTVSIPKTVGNDVSFSIDPEMFSGGAVDNGDGTWTLTFGDKAQQSLAGSFAIYLTTVGTGTIGVGGATAPITVIPRGTSSGTGTYTDAIMKDVEPGGDVHFGDYDYSEGNGNDAAQIGVADLSKPHNLKYRLLVNQKKAVMDHVVVVDTLPDGMTFDRSKAVEVEDSATRATIDPSLYTVTIEGQTLTFTYPGTLNAQSLLINYWVDVPAGNTTKYTNRAEVRYNSAGVTYQEHRNYVLQGADYSSAFGEKSVDKTVVTADPDDQMVTYTFKFWNNKGFAKGDIKLDDVLDSHVRFVYADQNPKFNVTYDKATNTVHVENKDALSSSKAEYVRFVVDFSGVPEGYTVKNTVGGNTTKTIKMPKVQLGATKTVNDGKPTDKQTYTFQLKDASGNVLQEVQNDGSNVSFDPIYYSEDDLNADGSDTTISYQVKEVAGTDAQTTYDATVYDVAVTLHRSTNADGGTTVTATSVITRHDDGQAVDAMTFNNQVSQPLTLPETGQGGLALVELVGTAVLVTSAMGLRRRRREWDAPSAKGGDRDE